MSQRKKEVRESFQRGASTYEDMAFLRSQGTRYEDFIETNFLLEKKIRYLRGNILDLGVGTGRLVRRLVGLSYNLYGIDISRAMIRKALKKIRNREINFIVADIEHLPFKHEIFDVAICFRVIKYASNPNAVVKEAYRVVKEGCILVIEAPNKNVLYVRIPLIIVRFLSFFGIKSNVLKYYLIVRFFTLKEMMDILQKVGFRVFKILTTLRLPHPFYERAISELESQILQNIEGMLSEILPKTVFSRSYIFCCQKFSQKTGES